MLELTTARAVSIVCLPGARLVQSFDVYECTTVLCVDASPGEPQRGPAHV